MGRQVTVIGGGVVGLASAYALVRAGHDVTLIEGRDSLASGTSFANGGQLSYRYVAPLADAGVPWQALGWMLRGDSPLRLRLRMDPAQWRWLASFMAACRQSVNRRNGAHLLELALRSQAALAQWREQDTFEDFAWRRNGKLVVFRSEQAFAKARANLLEPAAQQVVQGSELPVLERALADTPFIGGIHTPDEEVADCHRFCLALAARLQASGRCRFLLGRPVSRFLYQQGRVLAVQLGEQQLAFEDVVLCAGHRSAELALPGVRLPLYPLKGYSLTAPILAQHQAPEVSITDYERKVVYALLHDQLRVAAMVDIVGYDETPDVRRLQSLDRQARATLPQAAHYEAAQPWAGMRPATPSGVPLIGATAYRNLWLNLGHGALGFTLACGSAERLVGMMG